MNTGEVKNHIKNPTFSTFQVGTSPFAMEMFGIARLFRISTIIRSTPAVLLVIPLNDHNRSILCSKMKNVRILKT
jgi:hypothetical protein